MRLLLTHLRRWSDYIILLALPWILMLVSPNWLYTSISYIDPWIYHGYFNDLSSMLETFPGAYYGSRLAYILPGWLCYRIPSAIIANGVLHLGFYYVAVFALYGILKIQRNSWALIIMLLTGLYPLFVNALGWDYIDGAGIAYILLTFLCLTVARRQTGSRWLILLGAGVSYGCAIHTNLFLVALAPVILVYYKPFSIWHFEIMIIGTELLTILLGFISVSFGGNFLFFVPSLDYSLSSLGQPNIGLGTGWSGTIHNSWLLVPAIVLVLSLWKLGRSSISYILLVGEYILLGWRWMGVLDCIWYVSYLIPVGALVVGDFFSTIKLRGTWIVTIGVIVVMLVANKFYPGNVGTASELSTVYKIEQQVKDVDLYFWYDIDESTMYRAIASTHLWSYRLVSEDFPYLNGYKIGPVSNRAAYMKPGLRVAILSRDDNVLIKANNTLGSMNLKALSVDETVIDDIHLTLVDIATN